MPQVGLVQPGAQVVPMRGRAYEGPENEGDEQNEEAIPLDDLNPEPLRFSPASPRVTMVSGTAAGSGVQTSGVIIGKCVQVPEVKAGEVQLSQQVSRQPEVQASEAYLSQQVLKPARRADKSGTLEPAGMQPSATSEGSGR